MIRIAGVVLPENKRIEIALTYIYGIGSTTSLQLLDKLGMSYDVKVKDISGEDATRILQMVGELVVEGDLRRKIQLDIRRLESINCYRGIRHRKNLPVRGQHTRRNARTNRKGKKRTVANKKLATK